MESLLVVQNRETLVVRLFGGITLRWGEQSIPPIASVQARSLLAYLALHCQQACTRDLLAGLFWPEQPDAVARKRLSQALWQVHTALNQSHLPTEILLIEGNTLRIHPDLPTWIDVEEFSRLLAQPRATGASALERYELAIQHYAGEFMEGYYQDWVVVERERLHQLYLDALEQLVYEYKRLGDYTQALVHARRLASADPWREETIREIMRLCHLNNQDLEALEQYGLYRQILADELKADPSTETIALASEIAARAGFPGYASLPSKARQLAAFHLERPDRLPLVGRRFELAELLRRLESAAGGNGSLTLLLGEAGIGKSHLVRGLAENARWRGVRTVWGRCYDLSTPLAYQPLVEALREGIAALTPTALEDIWYAELSRLLPELSTQPFTFHQLQPEEERRRLLEAITRGFECLGKSQPTLVILEDIQWIDAASLDTLLYGLPRLLNHSLMIVMTLRSEELVDQRANLLSAIEGRQLTHRITLQPLSETETGELIQKALALEQPAPRFSARLFRESEGNPFYIIELVQMLVEEGLLYRDETGTWSTPWDESTQDYQELPLPAGVYQSVAHRLDRLADDLKDLLELAAAIGREVDFAVWTAASQMDERNLLAACDELSSRGLIVSGGSKRFDYLFTHEQIRRVAYDRCSLPQRRTNHRHIAQALLQVLPDQLDLLAHHWSQAQDWEAAAQYHYLAGERAFRLHANSEALSHHQRALQALHESPGLPKLDAAYSLHMGCETIYSLLGDRSQQEQEIQCLIRLAKDMQDQHKLAEVELRQAGYLEATGDYPGAIQALQRVLLLCAADPDDGKLAAALQLWGSILLRQGSFQSAEEKMEKALELARRAGLASVEADCLRDLGRCSYYLGNYEHARQCYHASLQLGKEAGDQSREWTLYNYLGLLSLKVGQYDRAITDYLEALNLSRSIGDRRGEGMVLNNLGVASRRKGDYPAARDYHQAALLICQEIDDRWNQGQISNNLGILALDQGDYTNARFHFQKALQIWEEIDNPHGAGAALANLGCLLRQLGEYSSSRDTLQKALVIFQKLGDRQTESVTLCDLSLTLHRLGEHQAALDAGQLSLEIASQRGLRPAQGNALVNIGHAQVGSGLLQEAENTYQQAVEIRQEMGERHLVMEAAAGLVQVSLLRGQNAQALEKCEQILNFLQDSTLEGVEEPFWIYLICIKALSENHDPRARELLAAAYRLLQAQAEKIGDEQLRHSFLHNVEANREIAAYYQIHSPALTERENQSCQIAVSLPSSQAPLGRPLRQDEFIEVIWTISAPEDAVIPGKAARRQQRLLRLLEQAQSQGASPRDEDLASALQVSLATLRRDIAELRAQGHQVITRWRKMST
ncbi:MAG: tetratricopeptide repeat protein [Anaerolineales bacterium]|nr:tetratricopeptide repeat protein [Anaerolineales bacterium]